jgi:hypothetical protein
MDQYASTNRLLLVALRDDQILRLARDAIGKDGHQSRANETPAQGCTNASVAPITSDGIAIRFATFRAARASAHHQKGAVETRFAA